MGSCFSISVSERIICRVSNRSNTVKASAVRFVSTTSEGENNQFNNVEFFGHVWVDRGWYIRV